MKRNTIITTLALATTVLAIMSSCGDKRSPGRIYMPDMTYSRAIETYSLLDSTLFTDDSAKRGEFIYYNRRPAAGTIKRGELFPFPLANDSDGYKMSATIKNPLAALSTADSSEASRLFNINCAICHGADGKADGPLSSKIGGIANFTQPQYVAMQDGTMFYSINYGKNNMGSYASQLDRKQRWMIIKYIRTLQPKPDASAATGTTKADSTSSAKK